MVIMDLLGRIAESLGESSGTVFLVLCVVVPILGIATIWLSVRVRRLSRARALNLSGENAERLARDLAACAQDIKGLQDRAGALSSDLDRLARQQLLCLQRVGFVRFDAFDDVGGEQSFALALLDGNGNGLVVSSIYSRRESRIYAKQISAGNASHTLSREEEEAIRQATAA